MIEHPLSLGFVMPVQLEYFSGWTALGLFVLIGIPIVWLGLRSLAGLGKVRQRVAIVLRLLVLLLMIVILGGIRVVRHATDLEVMVLRDISQSTANVIDYPGQTLQSSIDNYLAAAASKDKKPDDRIGVISFKGDVQIDALPATTLALNSRAIPNPDNATDVASAIQLGLATLRPDAMHRLLLMWDGNATVGDTQSAISAAIAQHVPIDVMPLHYDVQHEVLMDRFIAPTWRRENEPFNLDLYLKSTNTTAARGKLTVLHQGVPIDLDPTTPGLQATMPVTLAAAADSLHPSVTHVSVRVPALQSVGVHQFHASFEADPGQGDVNVSIQNTAPGKKAAGGLDTLTSNNGADAFTFVKGKGQILYVDNVPDGRGEMLRRALSEEGIEITEQNHIRPDEFPNSQIQLESYDAIILANVSRGPSGLNDDQQKILANYVHDMGGGLVMIGGPETFGAGGWQGSKLEEVLPVNMDIPAQRQIPKGALVLAMDSAEVPNGNYWSEQCAIKAVETLSSQDDVGIITFNWNGGGAGCNWDLPLGPKGDGSKAVAAMKKWGLGDLPSFEQAINLALDGDGTSKGILASDAKQKHIIVITDDDPEMPSQATIDRCIKGKVTVSTVTVYPHTPHNVAAGTRELAKKTGGRVFGPIEDNPGQLPQIFIKEATVVRRSLITEDEAGIALHMAPTSSDMVKGLGDLPMVKGMVLTSKKNSPQINIPIVAGRNNDPVLAHWQTGLGRAAVFTSDANNAWGVWWVASPSFNKFWAQVVRTVARPPMSSLFDVTTTQSGDKGHIVVEALDKNSAFLNFLNVAGKVTNPDPSKPSSDVRLVQTGPGRYETTFNTNDPGTYVAALEYHGEGGQQGVLLSGVAMNSSAEQRDLQSNDALLHDIVDRTKGRFLTPFDSASADLFTRNNVPQALTLLPVWQTLIPFLIALILIDIAARRIAWNWAAIKSYLATASTTIRSYTTTRTIETTSSLDALKKVRQETTAQANTNSTLNGAPKPDPRAKFVAAKGIEGDISKVVGGASDKPIPPPPKKIEPKGTTSGGGMSSLMEAKRRAQQQIKQKESGD